MKEANSLFETLTKNFFSTRTLPGYKNISSSIEYVLANFTGECINGVWSSEYGIILFQRSFDRPS